MTTDQKVRGSTPLGRAIYYFNMRNREVAQLGRAHGLGPWGRRFESCLPDHFYGALAQLGERLLCTQEVSGSIPLGSTKKDSKKVVDFEKVTLYTNKVALTKR